jgi:hypothetical protein
MKSEKEVDNLFDLIRRNVNIGGEFGNVIIFDYCFKIYLFVRVE